MTREGKRKSGYESGSVAQRNKARKKETTSTFGAEHTKTQQREQVDGNDHADNNTHAHSLGCSWLQR